MKRDMDLIREILLAIETIGPPQGLARLDLPGHDPETVSYHVRLLDQAGLITAVDFSTAAGLKCQSAASAQPMSARRVISPVNSATAAATTSGSGSTKSAAAFSTGIHARPCRRMTFIGGFTGFGVPRAAASAGGGCR